MTMDRLTPAEAALLLDPRGANAGLCLQAALLTLIGKGHLRLEEEGRWIKHRYLRPRQFEVGSLPRHLATVWHALAPALVGGRVEARAAAIALRKVFGNDFRSYVHDVLAPPLVRSGLLQREDRRFVGLIPYARYQRTPSGDARIAPLRRIIDQAAGMRRMVRNDPDRALALARAAGILLILSPETRASLSHLKRLLSERGDGGSSHVGVGSDSDQRELEATVEVGDVGLSLDLGGTLDDIAGIGGFTDGDGGGDGGDGGGGGD
jgi:hypothetical protein